MLKTFCVTICACMMLSACGGGGNSGFTSSSGGGSGSTAWVTGQIPCDSGCSSTQSGMQIQIQPSTTVGTGSTLGCSFEVELSNTSTDLGLPSLTGALAYVSLTAPTCGAGAAGTTWTATITFTSVNGGTTNWPSVTASMLSAQNQWTSVTPTSTASSLTINATVVSKAVTNFAIAN